MSSLPSTFTPNKGIEMPAAGSYNDTWATPVNADWMDIDNALAGHTQIDVTGIGSGVYTFALAQYQPPNIAFIGTWSTTLVYLFPPGIGWVGSIFNSTAGAIIVGATSGSSITIPAGRRFAIVSDGVNMQFQQSPTDEGPPSALVGLSPITGANGTVMDSGSAPALDQSISPTWTGSHLFTGPVNLVAPVTYDSSIAGAAGTTLDASAGAAFVATEPPGTNDTHAASTAFVEAAIAPLAPINNPVFTGNPEAPTPASGDASVSIATTAFVNPGASLNISGYRKNTDGSIEQWGLSPSAGNLVTITLPIPFPNKCFNVLLTPTSTTDFHVVDPTGLAGPVSQIQLFFNTGGAQGFWRAFGH